jgi:hypothetical protein
MSVSWPVHDRARGGTGARILVLAAAAAVLAAAVLSSGAPAVAGAPASGTAAVFAGGVGGPGPGPQIGLSAPCSVASAGGHLYFTGPAGLASSGNVIRDLNERTGWMRTVAGIGLAGVGGVGGPAVQAEIGGACGLAVDHHGNLVTVSPFNPDAVTSISIVAAKSGDFYGQRMRAGGFYQITGQYAFGNGVAVDYAGNLVITVPGYVDTENITEWTAFVEVLAAKSGVFYGQRMKAGQFYSVLQLPNTTYIGGVTVDGAGNPVVGMAGVDATEVIAARSGTFDGRRMRAGRSYPLNIGPTATVDRYGNFVFIGWYSNAQSNGQRLAVLAERSGVFYGRRMRAGHVYTFAEQPYGSRGDGGPVSSARFGPVSSLTVDSAGNWVLADADNRQVRVVAIRSGRFYGQAMRTMDVYSVAGTGSSLSDSGDGGQATRAELGEPPFPDALELFGVAADPASDVYLSDTPDYRVQMVPARSGVFFGQKMRAGDIYTIAGDETRGDAASGVLARSAELGFLGGLMPDRAGNVLFADPYFGKLRVVAAKTGTFYGVAMRADRLYTIAGGGTQRPADGVAATAASLSPADVGVDSHGNAVFTDNSDLGRVFAVAASNGTFYGQQMTAGHLYLLAGGGTSLANGGPALSSVLYSGVGLAIDGAGNIVIADYLRNLVRVVAAVTGTFYGQRMTAGDIYTIAGGGTEQEPGHLGTASAIGDPEGVAIDRSGNVLVSISGTGQLLQVIAARSETFYGQSMTAGHLYTIAGGGQGLIPGNRPATKIALLNPGGVAVEPSGDVLLAELTAGRVLLIHP